MIEQKQAIKDMIDFIAEFELWLEGRVAKYQTEERCYFGEEKLTTAWAFEEVLSNYRRCKERIEYNDE